jgi:orotate phosphoribosyltransferase
MTTFRTYYFDSAIRDLPGVIERAREALADVDFDTIVGTGFSGSIVIPALALSMGKKFVLIRKEGDDSHHGGGRLVGQLGERWIFVDDLVESGRTRSRVIRKVNDQGESPTTMVGQYLYEGDGFGVDCAFEPYRPIWEGK